MDRVKACPICGGEIRWRGKTSARQFAKVMTCKPCANRLRKRKRASFSDTIEHRFWPRVEKSDGCWEWRGHRMRPAPYGQLRIGAELWLTHRLSWSIHYGAVPIGLYVCHRCDNPACVRPDHLFLGTNSDNQFDSSRKGRHAAKRDKASFLARFDRRIKQEQSDAV